MKFVINDDLTLRRVNREHGFFVRDLFQELNVKFGYWNDGKDSPDPNVSTIAIRIEKGQVIELGSELMDKMLLNTIDAHTVDRLKYVYLGNLKFNVVYDK